MKILENVLSLDLLKLCQEELTNKLKTNKWKSSSLCWYSYLTHGIDGSTLTTRTSLDIQNAIKKEISPHVPECDITTQYYVWQSNSGISLHEDSDYKFGATIYLNDDWRPNFGGWFIWKDKEKWNTILPTKNLMVLNDIDEEHLVTRVASDIPYPRYSIQIWGIK
jgi:hypothetical protein